MYGMLPATGGLSPLRILYLVVAATMLVGGVALKLFR